MVRKSLSPEEEWRGLLLGTNPGLRAFRRLFLAIPSPPRCEFCAVPFAGPAAPLFKAAGKGPWVRNPRYCFACCAKLIRNKGGVELEASFLFADVRGSTPLGEKLGPTGLHDLMDRFYGVGIDALIAHGALIDRFMGDQVVGYFAPGFAGAQHAREAVLSGLDILRATGHDGQTPWVPVGAGVHTGVAFVGSVGKGDDMAELTALGDAVTIAARFASVAATGELIVSEDAFTASGLAGDPERRELTLKGVATPVKVRVLGVRDASVMG
jgi:adenylate cyclase